MKYKVKVITWKLNRARQPVWYFKAEILKKYEIIYDL